MLRNSEFDNADLATRQDKSVVDTYIAVAGARHFA